MKRGILYLIIITISLTSCNNSAKQAAEQQAREKFIADSVTQVIQATAVAKQNLEEQKNQLRKTIDSLEQLQYKLQQVNAQAKADLTAANDNLRSVSDFHLLRGSGERQAQIQQASLKVNEIQQGIVNLQERYTEVQTKLTSAKEQLQTIQ